MAYTPGVARISRAIADDPEKVWNLTVKQNAVAVVTDGTAVLGLGDIGPEAALPVMEGKAVLFKEFGGIDAWPVCLATKDPDEIVRTVQLLAPVFGGINLEDISAPRCFEVERRLRDELDIPVFHDDQHGTAIVVLAALLNALRVVNKALADVRVVITGAGAAGAATARMLLAAGAGEVLCADRRGLLCPGRAGLDPFKSELAAADEPARRDRIGGRRVVRSRRLHRSVEPGRRQRPRASARWRPTRSSSRWRTRSPRCPGGDRGCGRRARHRPLGLPEPDQQRAGVPGVFRGALDVRATAITREMELAAAHALAEVVEPDHLEADYVIPSVFDRRVAPAVAAAVAAAAETSGVARRRRVATAAPL